MFLAYHNRSKPTGELLAKVLQIQSGFDPAEAPNTPNERTLIRWGSRKNVVEDGSFEKVINNCEALELASHKMYSLELIQGAGVKVPDWDTDPFALLERVGYPILGRKFHHARGTDIKLCLQNKDFRTSRDYYVQYIPTKREYRLHVVGEKVIRIQGKFLDNPSESKAWIRNMASGYRFRAPRLKLRPDRLEASVAAVKSLGLDFGAVDLIIADDGDCYVLEVNTAPSCSPLTLGCYASELHSLGNLDTEIDLGYLNLLDPSLEEQDSEDEDETDFEGDN